jgi:hypothetical protein
LENTNPLFVGNRYGLDIPFEGQIDEFVVFNRALTSNDIAAIYAAGSAGMCAPTPDAPVVLVNGQFYGNNSATYTNAGPVTIEMHSTFPNATIFYSLDGSNPRFGAFYSGPFNVTDPAIVRAVAYNSNFTQSVEMDSFTLTLLGAPVILTQPQGQTVVAGDSATFTVTAGGPGPLAYQWRLNNAIVPGATSATLFLNDVQSGNTGPYTVIVTNPSGSVTSTVAQLTLLSPPVFTSLPPAVTNVSPGSNVTFCVTASGTPPLRFQWRRNGVNLSGQTNTCFTIPSVAVTDGGSYSVVVANSAGALESPPAVLNVLVTPTPPGDNYSQSTPIFGATNFVVGTNLMATREFGEPLHAGKRGSNSVWYSWTAHSTGIATFRTEGSSFDTLLAVYVGTNVTNLLAVASDEDRGPSLSSLLRFNAGQGTNFSIAIDGFAGGQGNFVLDWELVPTANTLPVITNQPLSQTVTQGTTLTLSVVATGSGLTYQWLLNGTNISGATNNSLTLSNLQPGQVGNYTVRVRNSAALEVESLPALIEIGTVPGFQSVDKYQDLFANAPPNGFAAGKSSSAVAVTSSGSFIPVGQGAVASQILNNTGASTQPGEANPCGNIGAASRWVGLTPSADGTFLIDTSGSAIDTVLAVYTNDVNNLLAPLRLVACGTNNAPDGQHVVRFDARQGLEYLVAVDGINGAVGTIALNWRFGQPPALIALPPTAPALRVVRGGSVTLSVNLGVSVPSPILQWFHATTPRAEAISATFTLTNVQPADAGDYFIMASNTIGLVLSHVATLLVDAQPLRLADSGFESGTEDWTVVGQAGAPVPVFGIAGSTGGGYLSAHDTVGGATWYWRAPPGFRGNQSAAYGGHLAFDLKQTFTDQQYNDSDVILIGGGLTLVFDTAANPGTDWTSYEVPLQESAGWRLNNLAGRLATREEMLRALAALTDVRIRGEYSTHQDTGHLDNVALVAPSAPLAGWLSSQRLSGGVLAFEWPVLGGFQLEAASTLPFTNWAVLEPLFVSNGLNSATIDTSSGSFFFRLSKPVP